MKRPSSPVSAIGGIRETQRCWTSGREWNYLDIELIPIHNQPGLRSVVKAM